MEKINTFEEWISSLKKSKKLILVEGKKDKKSLSLFGIKNTITINKPFFEIVESIVESQKECIILVDLDREGRKIYSYFKRTLEKNGVKVDDKYRKFLSRKTKITNIESIKNYL